MHLRFMACEQVRKEHGTTRMSAARPGLMPPKPNKNSARLNSTVRAILGRVCRVLALVGSDNPGSRIDSLEICD